MTTVDEQAAAAARGGDEAAFSGFVARHRRELHVHAYRMTGNFDEAEDLVQETFLRAWRRRETYAGRSTFRAWLYRIATNACLDAIAAKPGRGQVAGDTEVLWLQPYPDTLLEAAGPSDDEPEALTVARETIEIAFLVAMQHLPPRQRAVLIVRDVLGWSAVETAELLEMSVAAANSALQRARDTLKEHLPERRAEWTAGAATAEERALVKRYVDAHERADLDGVAALVADDIRFWMPPEPETVEGGGPFMSLERKALEMGRWRLVPTAVNRMPATACYLQREDGAGFEAMALDVLRLADGRIAEITTFSAEHFPRLGLPAVLER